jgi:hypothetical protein
VRRSITTAFLCAIILGGCETEQSWRDPEGDFWRDTTGHVRPNSTVATDYSYCHEKSGLPPPGEPLNGMVLMYQDEAKVLVGCMRARGWEPARPNSN